MVTKKKKVKRKKVKYFKYTLSISKPEKEKMERYCLVHKTTPNKLIKKVLRDYIKRYGNHAPVEHVTKNQMNIFDIIEAASDN